MKSLVCCSLSLISITETVFMNPFFCYETIIYYNSFLLCLQHPLIVFFPSSLPPPLVLRVCFIPHFFIVL
eukprot:m.18187 g.18187  ORF g.18187 m.18187 type:complete len:70 (+) comp4922_c0_seq1:461-670(+)